MTTEERIGDPQSVAITTLAGVVTYLVYELTRKGSLDTASFRKHLEDLAASDSIAETEAERKMRATLIKVVRDAISEGESEL